MPDLLLEDADGAPYPEEIQRIWRVLGDDSITPLLEILTERGLGDRPPARSDVGRLLDHLKDGVRKALTKPTHYMTAPSAKDLRWTCSNTECDWTASDTWTTPEQRGARWFIHHGEVPTYPLQSEPIEDLPHSRACGLNCRGHGIECAKDCPTCHGSATERSRG